MTDECGDPSPPDGLPEGLREALDDLDAAGLRAVLAYVERRLESVRTPIRESIRSEAAGEVVSIDDRGPFALVRMRRPQADGSAGDAGTVSLYHVMRERRQNDETKLRWALLGDVREVDPE